MAYFPFRQQRSINNDCTRPVFTNDNCRVDDTRTVDMDVDGSTSDAGFIPQINFDALKDIISSVQKNDYSQFDGVKSVETVTDYTNMSNEALINEFESKCKEELPIMRRLEDVDTKFNALSAELKALKDTIKEKERFANNLKQIKITERRRLDQINRDKKCIRELLLQKSQNVTVHTESQSRNESSVSTKRSPPQTSLDTTPKKTKPNTPPLPKNIAKPNSSRNASQNQESTTFGVRSSRPVMKPAKKKTAEYISEPIPILKKGDKSMNITRKNVNQNSKKEGQESKKQAEDKNSNLEKLSSDFCELGYEEQENHCLNENGEEGNDSDNDIFAALETPKIVVKQEIKKEKDAEAPKIIIKQEIKKEKDSEAPIATKTEIYKINKPVKNKSEDTSQASTSQGSTSQDSTPQESTPQPMKCNLCEALFSVEKEMKEHIIEAHHQSA